MIWLMALTTGWATTTGAPVPVQGVLTGADGSPLNGTHNLTFRLHAAADGSSALHTDTSAVQLSSGGFAATISGVPLEVLPLLLAVEVVPDIFRTVGNVTADLAAARIVEGRDAAADPEAAAGV